MEAIIISGKPAAGKTTVARIIAERLGVKAIGGGEILKEMALERGYNAHGDGWWDTPEGLKFLEERKSNPDFDNEADRRLIKKIEAGDIVVTSYTAAWISKKGFKVWLEGSLKTRAARMGKRDNTDVSATLKVAKIRDEENQTVYKKLYKIDIWNDKAPFDMEIDTNKKTPEEIADIILEEYKKKNKM